MKDGFATLTIRAVPQKLRSFVWSFAQLAPQMLYEFDHSEKNDTGKITYCQELASHWNLN